jgi:hypothetical protein
LFAAALTEAFGDPGELRRRGEAARTRAERSFSSASWADQLYDRYAAVAAPRTAARA